MRTPLPLHPSLRHPLTGEPIRAVYANASGRLFWPVLGASETPPEPTPPVPTPAPTPAPPKSDASNLEHVKGELGKWRGRAESNYDLLRSIGVTSADDMAAVKEKLDKADRLEHELMSDKDKAIAEAGKTAKAEADSHYRPLLVRARFEAEAAGRIESERLATILEPLDLTKFLTNSGDVDTDKVSAYVNGIAQKGNPGPTPPRGPAMPGATRSSSGAPSVTGGKDLWNQMNPTRAVPTT